MKTLDSFDASNKKPKILIVDDSKSNREVLVEILSDIYETTEAKDGTEAISRMLSAVEKPHLVLLDVMMPIMDGFQVLEFMKSTPDLSKIPVILATASKDERKGLALGAVDYISKPFDPDVARLRIKHQIQLVMYRENLENMVMQKTNELLDTKQLFLDSMAQLIEYRSLESGDHVKSTRELAKILLIGLIKHGVYEDEIRKIDNSLFLRAVTLHDIGKIGVPDNILLKPGPLDEDEMTLMKTHTVTGSEIIRQLMVDGSDYYLQYCYEICRYHHEWWDGSGYPDNLSGTEIPLIARIVAVVDVYDALVSERCYKKRISHEKAVAIIGEGAGTQFDPVIVDVLLKEEAELANTNPC